MFGEMASDNSDKNEAMTGYLHSGYAESLSELGKPRLLPKSQGWILERQIPGFASWDAMGCYPLFTCLDWSQLQQDLDDIRDSLVSLAVVTDPFGTYDEPYLRRCFKDVVIPYKEHFIVDLSCPADSIVSNHHRRCARKALRSINVERCEDALQFLGDWVELYGDFIKKRNIRGPAALSRLSLAKQLMVPGLVMFRAEYKQTIVGIHLWYVHGNVGYAHLAAYDQLGYKLGASYALFWSAIEYFQIDQLRWLHLGGVAGVKPESGDGLTVFKNGWSTGTRTAYLCGRIFDRERYLRIVEEKGISATAYFPAYRNAEVVDTHPNTPDH